MSRRIVFALPLALALGACAVPSTSYIDTQYHVAHYEDLVVPAEPVPVRVEAHSKINDMATPKEDAETREIIKRVLIHSGVFAPSDDPATPSVLIVELNDIYERSQADKGYMTGLTFGSDKNTFHEDFEINVFFRGAADQKRYGRYKHQIVTTNGKLPPPDFVGRPMPVSNKDSVDYILQDALLNFLKDYQNAGDEPGSIIFVPTGAGTQPQ